MILYHGSSVAVQQPDLSYSRDNVDFGRGFYTTPIYEQAIGWAERFKHNSGQGVVSAYELNEIVMRKDLSILEFETYSDEWLDFIVACRRGENLNKDFDVIIGVVANDKVFNTLLLFFKGLIERKEAIKRLRYENPNIQYCFCKQNVVDVYLQFISSEEL
jgi:hypothetical protein